MKLILFHGILKNKNGSMCSFVYLVCFVVYEENSIEKEKELLKNKFNEQGTILTLNHFDTTEENTIKLYSSMITQKKESN